MILVQFLLTFVVVTSSTMMEGRGAPQHRKRRADALGARAAEEVPQGGIMLDHRVVPVLSFTGAPTGATSLRNATDTGVDKLGGKADAGRLVAMVEAEILAQQPSTGFCAAAAPSCCCSHSTPRPLPASARLVACPVRMRPSSCTPSRVGRIQRRPWGCAGVAIGSCCARLIGRICREVGVLRRRPDGGHATSVAVGVGGRHRRRA